MDPSSRSRKLTVLVDQGEVMEDQYARKSPERANLSSAMLRSPYLSSPYSGSVAGSTTKPARRRHYQDDDPPGHPGTTARRMDSLDSEPSSNGTLPTVGSKYEKIRRERGGNGESGGTSKKKGLKTKCLVPGLLIVFFASIILFYHPVTVDKIMRYNLGDDTSTPYRSYDPSVHTDDYEAIMSSASKMPWNSRRQCMSGEKYAQDNHGAEKLPDLIRIHAWKSRKEVKGKSISLVTHLSVDRIPSLEQQCSVWPDKIVAAVYIPMTTNSSGGLPLLPGYSSTTLDDMIRGIGSFHVYMEKTAVCSLDLVFYGQFVEKQHAPGSYPSNALRNKALSLVETELSLHANVDIIVNPYLDSPERNTAGYKDPETYSQLVITAKKNTAFVLPVLDVVNGGQDARIIRNVARSQALAGKKAAKDFIARGILKPYVAPEDLEKSIWSVNLERWAQTSPKDGHLLIKLDKGAPPVSSVSEACILVSTEKSPWFDERFVDNGPGFNIWTRYLEQAKFKFRVHSSGFGIHLAHERSTAKSRYLMRRREFRLEVMQFLNSTLQEEIAKGKFKPMMAGCGNFPKVSDDQNIDAMIE
jgi:hypothetical protein